MKRALYLSSFILMISLVVVGSIAWSKKAQILSHILSLNLMMPVNVERVDFSGKGLVVLSGVSVSNPKGVVLPEAFSAKTITIQYDATSIYKEGLKIKEIYLEGVTLGLEVQTTTGDYNNWARLFKPFYTESPSPDNGIEDESSCRFWLGMSRIERIIIDKIRCELVDKSLRKDNIDFFKIQELKLDNLDVLGWVDHSVVLQLMIDPILLYVEKLACLPHLLDRIPCLPSNVMQIVRPQVEKQFFSYQSHLIYLQKSMQSVQVSLDEQKKVLQERFLKMQEAYDQFTSSLDYDVSIEEKGENET